MTMHWTYRLPNGSPSPVPTIIGYVADDLKQKFMYRQIETERLLIRPIKITDTSFILDLLNSDGWLQFIGDR